MIQEHYAQIVFCVSIQRAVVRNVRLNDLRRLVMAIHGETQLCIIYGLMKNAYKKGGLCKRNC